MQPQEHTNCDIQYNWDFLADGASSFSLYGHHMFSPGSGLIARLDDGIVGGTHSGWHWILSIFLTGLLYITTWPRARRREMDI